ncbi:MAG: metallophosphoesterase family protein [Candidatus Scalinduaceae bacterium]
MKIIIISDIHGNLEALNRTLEYIDKLEGNKRVVCLGDIVGYGPDPVECLEIVQSLTDKICLGNHDYAISNMDLDYQMTRYALEAIRWTRGVLGKETKKIIEKFHIQTEENSILYVHASPDNPMRWKYICNAMDAYLSMADMKCSLCFVGHSHIPGVYADYKLYSEEKKTILTKKGKTIVNVGSVGQPRDGSPLLSFAIFDDVDWNVEIVRLTYNYQETMAKIKKVGLPLFLAERLSVGI